MITRDDYITYIHAKYTREIPIQVELTLFPHDMYRDDRAQLLERRFNQIYKHKVCKGHFVVECRGCEAASDARLDNIGNRPLAFVAVTARCAVLEFPTGAVISINPALFTECIREHIFDCPTFRIIVADGAKSERARVERSVCSNKPMAVACFC